MGAVGRVCVYKPRSCACECGGMVTPTNGRNIYLPGHQANAAYRRASAADHERLRDRAAQGKKPPCWSCAGLAHRRPLGGCPLCKGRYEADREPA